MRKTPSPSTGRPPQRQSPPTLAVQGSSPVGARSSPTMQKPSPVLQKPKPSTVASRRLSGGGLSPLTAPGPGGARSPGNIAASLVVRPASSTPPAEDEPFVPEEEEPSAEWRSGATQGDHLMMAKAKRQSSGGGSPKVASLVMPTADSVVGHPAGLVGPAADDEEEFVPEEEETSAEWRDGATQGDHLMMAKAKRQSGGAKEFASLGIGM